MDSDALNKCEFFLSVLDLRKVDVTNLNEKKKDYLSDGLHHRVVV